MGMRLRRGYLGASRSPDMNWCQSSIVFVVSLMTQTVLSKSLLGGTMTDEAKFNRFSISLKDFEKSRTFLKEANGHEYGSLVHEALVFAAIICYFRPFTQNEGSGKASAASQLQLSDFESLTSEESTIHEKCKELRNKALAHAEFRYYPTHLNFDTGMISSTWFSLVGKAPDLGMLAALIEKLIQQCRNKRADYVEKVRST